MELLNFSLENHERRTSSGDLNPVAKNAAKPSGNQK